MKKWVALTALILLLASCATTDYASLESRISKLEKKSVMEMATGAGASFYPFHALTGGGTGALDKPDASTLNDGDVGFVVLKGDASYGNAIFIYVLDANSGATASSPFVITPSGTAGNKRWVLASSSTAPPTVVSSTRSLTVAECRSGFAWVTGAYTVSLPAAATVGFGTMTCLYSSTANQMLVDPNGTEKINLKGGALAAGNSLKSPAAAGDFVCLVSTTDTDGSGTDGWIQLGMGKTDWTDNGS